MATTNGQNGGGPVGAADSPHAGPSMPLGGDPMLDKYFGPTRLDTTDPGHQPPSDPLLGPVGARAQQIYRQIPLVTVQHDWSIAQVRAALRAHVYGVFDGSGQLIDALIADDRVQATLGSRGSGLFGHEVRFKPANDSDAAKECLIAWQEAWPKFATAQGLQQINEYNILMGFMPAQLLWDTSGRYWNPTIEPWHPRYTYWHWFLNRYIALTLDNEMPIIPGDGKWFLRTSWGQGANGRSWMRGAVRAIAEPWLFRHWAIRDLARYTEVHGMPIRKAIVPAASDEVQRDRYAAQLANLGNETTVMVAKGVDGAGQDYDLELVEAKDTNWEAMIGLRDHCDMAIVLSLLFQNLTTEVTGGSFAATKAHMDIRSSGIENDNESWKRDLREQVARPFASINFGDADLAPITDWDVQPLSDWDAQATMLAKFGTAIEVLRRGGVQFANAEDVVSFAKTMGIKLPPVKLVEPVSGGMGGAK